MDEEEECANKRQLASYYVLHRSCRVLIVRLRVSDSVVEQNSRPLEKVEDE